ncbi:coenzyme F420-0:L-glutamate ligase [Thermomicrobiaceae bacterium CFH 74404]|uniref:Coenzyme F420-0:L-glutamate ligase n=1 Tax=Thermalbibacter longus TaxID=2951981 RepID=A0AA41WCN5_9BACT|nr:coenzyme F420-0:L-glutamate ligase [Thermalbibacter longus]MCM8750656.1 coenzyme F420-0:L-glutamate ligase [Thermalbibacter longus]
MAPEIRIIGVEGIPEARAGDDVADLIATGLEQSGLEIETGDVLVVTHKLVSKAEGRLVALETVQPSAFAEWVAHRYGKDPRQVEVVLRESARIVRMDRGIIIAETRHGFVCANAGVDASNVPPGHVSLLPKDPDASAAHIRASLIQRFGREHAVIITDSFGRPWRNGIVNIAIGAAGMQPLLDYRGQADTFGNELRITIMAVADELAAAAELVMGKVERCPAAIVRGYRYQPGPGRAADLVMPPERDLFR